MTIAPQLATGLLLASCASGIQARAQAANPPPACTVAPRNAVTFLPTPGQPFEPIPSRDGCWVFVSVAGPPAIAVYRREGGDLKLVRTAPLDNRPSGMVLTHDGKLLFATAGAAVLAIDVEALTSGKGQAELAAIASDRFRGAIYVNVTRDDSLMFVANEDGGSIGVVDLKALRAGGFQPWALTGTVPAGRGPIAVTLSPDGSRLYTTSELAPITRGVAATCKAEGGNGGLVPPGEIEVIDVERARTAPAQAVVSIAPAGCSPVRLVLSADGAIAYVTARGENDVLAFDTAKLVTDPAHALLARAPVGTAPVGIALAGDRLIVTNSNRFSGGATPQSLTALSADWRTWAATPRLQAQIPAGAFPREERLSPDGSALYVTNFASRQLEMIDLARLPPLTAVNQP